MTQISPWGTLEAVSKEQDLNCNPTGSRFIINPPPPDGRCNVCGRHMSELKPFGGPGDPLVGDFSGELLVKKFRADHPYDEEAEKAWEEYAEEKPPLVKFEQPIADGVSHAGYEEHEDPIHWFISKFGEEKGTKFYLYQNSVGPSWECRDCAVLHGDEYFEKLRQRYQEHGNE